jgi:phage tail sheath gpL-like
MSYFSGGTTADSNANVITYLEGLNHRFYYIVSAAVDSTQLVALSGMVNLMALPATGIRQRMIAGSNDTLANVEAVTTAVNAPRAEVVWMQNSDIAPSRLAAIAASVYSAEEASLGGPFTVNFNFFGSTPSTSGLWQIPAPLDGTSASQSARISALNSGVTPIVPTLGGNTELLRRITTYFLNGAVNDYRCRDSSQVTICDFFADDVSTAATLQFAGATIGNNPAPGALPPPVGVVTPRVYRSLINNFISIYDNRGLLQNAAATVTGTNVIRESSPSTRISAQVPLQPVEILNQIGLVVDQDTPSQ